MKRKIAFVICLTFVMLRPSFAQQVTVDATIDSLQILIGEQTKVRLQVSVDADKRVDFPVYRDTLTRGVELLYEAEPDTQLLNNGKRMLITHEYTITSFDSALYYLPPMPVRVDSTIYRSNALALMVYTMVVPLDPENPDAFFGPNDVMKAPFVWSDWYGVIVRIVLLILIGFLLVYLVKRFFDNKPIVRRVKVEPKLPPHQLAMQEMERIKGEKIWQQGRAKEYYTELTDALRTYIKERFGFDALEMTTSEIIDKLLEVKDREALADLKKLLQTADLVKFAKHSPMMNENDANLINAIEFVNNTKEEEDPNAKPQPTEVTIVEKRPLRTKILLGVAVIALVVIAVFFLIYVISEFYSYLA